jgi:hypothetical protein
MSRVNLNFSMQRQEQTQWCWSAVATSVSHFFDPASKWRQCVLVNEELGQSNCCQNGSSTECNQPWYLDKALKRTGNLSYITAGTSTLQGLVDEISARRPFGARIGWSGGGGHFVILSGYEIGVSTGGGFPPRVSTSEWVLIDDPWYGESWSRYNDFAVRYQGSGAWTHSYFTRP